jgi:3-dehydroquinate synthase
MTNAQSAGPQAPQIIHLPLGDRSYDITLGAGTLDRLEEFLAPLVGQARLFVITEETVSALFEQKVKAALARGGFTGNWFSLAPGEGSKSFASFEALTNELLDTGIERTDIILALGGGVIGDLAGFAAASLLRGIDFIQIPTTLLAQVDSSVGGKTGINTPHGKNLIGAFHQPKAVLIDPAVLASLPIRDLKAGYAEVLKYALIDDPDFFIWLEENGQLLLASKDGARQLSARLYAIKTSVEAKARIVADDEREAGKRALLNLGHTFGHALEAECGYDGTLLHGEGVAIGMVMALDLSVRLGIARSADLDRVITHLKGVGMMWSAADIGLEFTADALLAHMSKDKKSKAGDIGFILGGIGTAVMRRGVDLNLVRAVLDDSICGKRAE